MSNELLIPFKAGCFTSNQNQLNQTRHVQFKEIPAFVILSRAEKSRVPFVQEKTESICAWFWDESTTFKKWSRPRPLSCTTALLTTPLSIIQPDSASNTDLMTFVRPQAKQKLWSRFVTCLHTTVQLKSSWEQKRETQKKNPGIHHLEKDLLQSRILFKTHR